MTRKGILVYKTVFSFRAFGVKFHLFMKKGVTFICMLPRPRILWVQNSQKHQKNQNCKIETWKIFEHLVKATTKKKVNWSKQNGSTNFKKKIETQKPRWIPRSQGIKFPSPFFYGKEETHKFPMSKNQVKEGEKWYHDESKRKQLCKCKYDILVWSHSSQLYL